MLRNFYLPDYTVRNILKYDYFSEGCSTNGNKKHIKILVLKPRCRCRSYLIYLSMLFHLEHAVAQWLRHCATNRKVAGSVPDGVRISHPSGRTMALGSTQPLTVMVTRNISWGKGGRCGRRPCPLHVLIVLKSGNLSLPEPSGPVKACNGIALLFHSVVPI
jgi:hypothetical protein